MAGAVAAAANLEDHFHMVKHEIAGLVRAAVAAAQASGELPVFDLPVVTVGRPKEETHGDYDCPLPLKLARVAGMPPMKIAQTIARHLPAAEFVAKVEVAAPGFLNFSLSDSWLAQQVNAVLSAGDAFGDVSLGVGKRVQVEFVSANPTGPFTSVRLATPPSATRWRTCSPPPGTRWSGSTTNDTGNQIRHFAETLYARYAQALGRDEPMPKDGYAGAYMLTIADQIVQEEGSRLLDMPREEAVPALVTWGYEASSLAWTRTVAPWESALTIGSRSAACTPVVSLTVSWRCSRSAVWSPNTMGRCGSPPRELGQDKDNVIVRSTGDGPTYFASDIAYMWNKLVDRGFDRAIYVWGADHQGDVPRLKAVAQVLGLDPERVTFLLYQMVTLKRGGEIVRLSKRTGISSPCAKWWRTWARTRCASSCWRGPPRRRWIFDLQLAKEQSDENPVYYVQYGHARIASILRHAEEWGQSGEGGDVSLLTQPAELALIRRMLQLPELVEVAVEELTPHVLPHYALDLAALFHSFYKQCRVVSSLPEDRELSMARLRLARAAQIVLARSLHLMGLSAPERM